MTFSTMTKSTIARWGILGLVALLSVPAVHASGLVADWQFNESRGTRLNALTESVSGTQFNRSARGVRTTGDGALRIRRDRPRGVYYHAPLEIDNTRPVWLVVDIRSWQLEGEANEILRFGLSQGIPRAEGYVDIRLSRSDSNRIMVEGRAHGHRSRVSPRPIFGNPQEGPASLVLEIQPDERRYRIHYREGDGPWSLLGSGRTHAERSANYLRLLIQNQFNDTPQEHFDVSRIRVTYDNPLGQ